MENAVPGFTAAHHVAETGSGRVVDAGVAKFAVERYCGCELNCVWSEYLNLFTSRLGEGDFILLSQSSATHPQTCSRSGILTFFVERSELEASSRRIRAHCSTVNSGVGSGASDEVSETSCGGVGAGVGVRDEKARASTPPSKDIAASRLRAQSDILTFGEIEHVRVAGGHCLFFFKSPPRESPETPAI